MPYQKAVTDAVTGKTVMVDLSPSEIAAVEQLRHQAESNASALANKKSYIAQAVAALPTVETIRNAKDMAQLVEITVKLRDVIALLVEQMGLA